MSPISGTKRVLEKIDSNLKKPKKSKSSKYFELLTGAKLPKVQFGTYKMKGEACHKSVLSALRLGYRGIDTASVYDNEKEIGLALEESGRDRGEVFIQSKLWRSFVGKDTKSGKPRCLAELRKSLKRLGTNYLDLWLMHWPGPGRHLNHPPVRQGMQHPKETIPGNETNMVPKDWSPAMRLETYRHMAGQVGPDREVRALGVCNFSARQLRELVEFCKAENLVMPAVVQNEFHPYLQAKEVREYCHQNGIIFQAYASLGAGSLKLLEEKTVISIAKTHAVTPAQVLLRWGLQHGVALLPKSVDPARQATNLQVVKGWSLSQDEMASLDRLEKVEAAGSNTMVGWLREHDPDFY